MAAPVVHFQIEGRDGAALRAFYAGLFGWKAQVDDSNPAQYAMLSSDEVAGPPLSGAISQVPDEPSETWQGPTRGDGYPGHVTIYVAVPDVGATLELAGKLGGHRMLGPDPLWPGVEQALVADPEDNIIGLITQTA